MAFGLDTGSLAEQAAWGTVPDYATLWVGAWTLRLGWRDTDRDLGALHALNITPAVHFYYWGDDIAPACLSVGCAGKDMAGWRQLGQELGTHLATFLGGAPAVVLLESEFNKASVARFEPLDAALAERADELHAAYPPTQVVLALGNWNRAAWGTWDRAAAASNATGVQAITASTRDTPQTRDGIAQETLDGARELRRLFGKPVLVQDLAIASYPDAAGARSQAEALRLLLACLAPLKAAGVVAILYRSFLDAAGMDTANYFGEAERHFGLARTALDLKPAALTWAEAVAGERAAPAQAADALC